MHTYVTPWQKKEPRVEFVQHHTWYEFGHRMRCV